MSKTVISVENLSKAYRLGQIGTGTLTNDMKVWWAKKLGKPNPMLKLGEQDYGNRDGETLWALKDVSFQVEQGEVLGIIGRNGAGKSTLLKILSRVTAPTSGVVKVKGRIASLLEVGTGFHPDLTGRENIYLNGAIQGMTKEEIQRKFDEIVAFAEVEKFVDTPVKRYSSGMYVRLAFAVAAHLESEILLIDEVLAVGDAEFQKKCLGKMGDVASKEGRTVFFVSHNMQAIQSLCGKVLQLSSGKIVNQGISKQVISQYLAEGGNLNNEVTWNLDSAPGNSEVKLIGMRIHDDSRSNRKIFSSKYPLTVEMDFTSNTQHSALCVGFDLITPDGVVLLRSYQTDTAIDQWPKIRLGENHWYCMLPAGFLNYGMYYLCPRIGMHYMYWIVEMDAVIKFEVELDHGVSPLWNSSGGGKRPGIVAPIIPWKAIGESTNG